MNELTNESMQAMPPTVVLSTKASDRQGDFRRHPRKTQNPASPSRGDKASNVQSSNVQSCVRGQSTRGTQRGSRFLHLPLRLRPSPRYTIARNAHRSHRKNQYTGRDSTTYAGWGRVEARGKDLHTAHMMWCTAVQPRPKIHNNVLLSIKSNDIVICHENKSM